MNSSHPKLATSNKATRGSKENYDQKTSGICTLAGSEEVKQKERRVDAWALRAEEGRDKLRKAAGRSKYPEIRGYPNGETLHQRLMETVHKSIVCGGRPGELKHLSSRRKREQP